MATVARIYYRISIYWTVTIALSSVFVILSFQVNTSTCYRGTLHPLTYQRQIDYLDVEQYFRNGRLMRIQIMCIIYDEPCDFVGRWLKRKLERERDDIRIFKLLGGVHSMPKIELEL